MWRHIALSCIFCVLTIITKLIIYSHLQFAVIYTTCGGLSDDEDERLGATARRDWGNYEMSPQNEGGGRRRRHRGSRQLSMDKQEPLVGVGSSMPAGTGITDNEGFITDMVSTSSDSSAAGSHRWESGHQFGTKLS